MPCPAAADRLPEPAGLAELYDAEIEAAVRDAYQRDYVSLGFGPWR